MTSPPPAQGSKRRRVRDAVERNVRRVRRTFRPSPSARPSSPSGSSAASPSTRSPSPSPPGSHILTSGSQPAPPNASGTTVLVAGPSMLGARPASAPVSRTQATSHRSSTLEKLKDAREVAWNGLETTLRALGKSADEFPPLRSAVDSLVACLDIVQAATVNDEDYGELVSELTETAGTLSKCMGQLSLQDHEDSVAQIASSIEAQVTHIDKQRRRGKGKRVIEATKDKDDIVKNYRQIEKLFRRLQNEINIRTLQNTNDQLSMTLLQRLSAVDEARYNSSYAMTVQRRACTPETRENVQAALQGWVQDPKSAKVYWMNGMAGTGKTTITYSLCEWLENNNLLGASFFCSRVSASCRTVNKVIPTLAYQLARYSPTFRSALCKVLKGDPDAGALNVVQQFEKLVRKPMEGVKDWATTGVVVVIDALDECEDNHTTRLILETILRLGVDLPVKFFVSSRPEPVIRDKMLSSSGYSPSVLHLHDIEQWIVEADIKKYFKEALNALSPPPSENDVQQLAKLSGKLFIYAATVARYILPDNASVNSGARLKAILAASSQPSSESGPSKRYKELDGLYTTVLASVFKTEALEQEEIRAIHLVLWTVVCAEEPMSVQTLAVFLNLSEQQVLSALQPLHSVLHVSEDRGLISTLHASFPDFMFDPLRSVSLHCNKIQHSQLLAKRCFDVMKEQLRFNICNLKSSFVFDEDVQGLNDRVREAISPALFYACRYFGEHLRQGDVSDALERNLENFLSHRLLFWVEVLNLKRCVALGASALGRVHTWMMGKQSPSAVLKKLSDAKSFVTRLAASACTRSTPHIYISMLSFCPKKSTLYKQYWRYVKGLVEPKGTAISDEEGAALATWMAGDPVYSVAFSPDGTCIVSGSHNNTIRVWDAHTGVTIAGPFQGHTGPISSVAFSPDGSRIVSGSDETIRVWDAHIGVTIAGPFQGHTGTIWSVAFSPDGSRIVSGSDDRTIRVWDAHIGVTIAGPFQGHTDSIWSVAFSPDGSCIVSGSYDETIRVWDAHTGATIAGPFQGHTGPISSVAFSPDSSRIVSGSDDKTIRVWDAHTGVTIAGPFQGHTGPIWSVAFSPDGSRIVSGSDDKTIRVWDAHIGVTIAGPFQGHTDSIWSVAFSPDGSRIVSGSYDETIRVWDAHIGVIIAGPFQGHTDSIWSVAFSPDGSRIVSGSYDETIRVWDAHTGVTIAGPFQGHTGGISSVAFSPDGSRIVSGSDDETIRVWDAHIGVTIAGPFQGHTGRIWSVAFSPDGSRIVSGSYDKTIRVWDAHTGATIAGPFQGHTGSIWSVAFSPDGSRIVSGSDDRTIRVWDAHTCVTIVVPFQGHTGSILSVAFSPDGSRIISSSSDNTIREWDVHTAVMIAGPFLWQTRHSTCSIQSIDFSGDGTRIVSCSWYDTIRVCNAPIGTGTRSSLSDPTEAALSGETSSVDHRPDWSSILTTRWGFALDGWITVDGALLFWVSPDLHDYLPSPSESLVIGPQGSLQIDYTNLLLGDRWSECWVGE